MSTPLAGIRVLDFTRYQQGPFATVMLADMGAEVIKVEEPGGGDFGRRMWKEPDGFSAFFEALDRGKKSVCIDLRKPAGKQLALRLGEHMDVVVENFRPGTMEAWGLGYEEFKAVNQQVIYAQATGWGTKGPLAKYPSFDQIAQAYSGYAQHSGGGPGHRPEVPYPGVADQSGGMNLAFGIMTALFVRERTGIGQKVEVSLLGTQLALQAPELLHYLHFGEERPREFRASSTVGHFQCADGKWVMIVGIDQKFWPRIAEALGLGHLVDDPRFARGFPRWQNREELQALEEAAFRELSSAEALGRLRDADVPASLVLDYAALANEEQPITNGYIVEQDHPRFGRQRVVGLHVQLSETPGRVSAPAPELGAHTREVLDEFGVPADEIERLARDGVVRIGAGAG
ncbi:MAG: formyl-CoA transferase [Anaerolinea sp.]|nr:formyl-CoA transferase [Anaerolinea sp.]